MSSDNTTPEPTDKGAEHDTTGHHDGPASPESPARQASNNNLAIPLAILGAGIIVAIALLITSQTGNSGDAGAQATVTVTAPANGEQGGQQGQNGGQGSNEMSEEMKETLAKLPRRDENDPLGMGEVDAPVVLIEYSDFRCPYCASFAVETKPELKKFVDDGTLRIEYRDVPMFGEDSERASHAARAAGEQGKFWEFHDALYKAHPGQGHPDLPVEKLREIAEQAGVPDLKKWESDLESDDVKKAVSEDNAEARGLGISSTPTFLVNDEPLVGAQPKEVFIETIERHAEKANSKD